ncbi:MAG: hypothetical protein ACI8Y7_000624 [Candidatus Woesearchaeota archaeon]|jgi:hypothetical protein
MNGGEYKHFVYHREQTPFDYSLLAEQLSCQLGRDQVIEQSGLPRSFLSIIPFNEKPYDFFALAGVLTPLIRETKTRATLTYGLATFGTIQGPSTSVSFFQINISKTLLVSPLYFPKQRILWKENTPGKWETEPVEHNVGRIPRDWYWTPGK